jgi:hypothetical protein
MWTLRKAQKEILEADTRRRFEDALALQIADCFPAQHQALGVGAVREAIRYGFERAGERGVRVQEDLCRWVFLMFTFGRDFDRDPELPWARFLLDELSDTPRLAMAHLYTEAADHPSEAKGLRGRQHE